MGLNVKIDYNVAEKYLKVFREIDTKGKPETKTVEELFDHEVMDQMVTHYNRPEGLNAGIKKYDLIDVVNNLGNDNFSNEKKVLEKMHQNLREKIVKREKLIKALEQIKEKEKEIVYFSKAKLNRFLPGNIDFNPKVFIVFTGYSGAYYIGQDITLDLEHISKSIDKIASTIAHELHHIEFNGFLEKNMKSKELSARNKVLLELIGGITGEGIAYYCVGGNPDKGITGYEELDNYESDIARWKEYFEEINDVMLLIMKGEMDKNKMYDWASKHMKNDFGAINIVGIKTIEAIFKFNGDSEIVNLVKSPVNYFNVYNRTAKYLNETRKFSYPLYNEKLLKVF